MMASTINHPVDPKPSKRPPNQARKSRHHAGNCHSAVVASRIGNASVRPLELAPSSSSTPGLVLWRSRTRPVSGSNQCGHCLTGGKSCDPLKCMFPAGLGSTSVGMAQPPKIVRPIARICVTFMATHSRKPDCDRAQRLLGPPV